MVSIDENKVLSLLENFVSLRRSGGVLSMNDTASWFSKDIARVISVRNLFGTGSSEGRFSRCQLRSLENTKKM